MSVAELQRKADEVDARAVMNLERAESNKLLAALYKHRYITGRYTNLQELGDMNVFADFIRSFDIIVEAVIAINGNDPQWQAWLESHPLEAASDG